MTREQMEKTATVCLTLAWVLMLLTLESLLM